MRVIFYAEPTAEYLNRFPKSSPDYESTGACYVKYQDMDKLKLRGNEPMIWAKYLEEGGTVYPLSILKEKNSF